MIAPNVTIDAGAQVQASRVNFAKLNKDFVNLGDKLFLGTELPMCKIG